MSEPAIIVKSVNISRQKGTIKTPVDEIKLNENGIIGDAHAGPWHRQVSLLSQEHIDHFIAQNNRPTLPGEFAENITLQGLDFSQVAPLDRFLINDTELQITQIGKKCHGDSCAIFTEVGNCIMPKEGLFAQVIKPGTIKPTDKVTYLPRTLTINIITLSDRAAAGVYEDKSGPKIQQILKDHFSKSRWHIQYSPILLPDDQDRLHQALINAINANIDIVITTGGTGIGPRDITPETVTAISDKLIPGIMDHIRIKYGDKIPGALLSRSVAAVAGKTLIFALPGSVKAVKEYMNEIVKVTDHPLFTINGVDRHS
ncbi:MAG: molybdenum cofactor synthesis protein [Phycisphaerae bacterium]|nr:molybdenum cofactor synthesis protein [Phycisphaerae bacterium]